jgi:hypothetical protein
LSAAWPLFAGAAITFDQSYKDFYKDFIAASTAEERIDLVDKALQKQLVQNSTFHEDEIQNLIKLRDQECSKNVKRCLDVSQWRARACPLEGFPSPDSLGAWRTVTANLKTLDQVNKFLGELGQCSSGLTVSQVIVACDALSTIEGGRIGSLSFTISRWLEDRFAKSPASPSSKLETVIEADKLLQSLRPVPVYGVAAAALAPLSSLNSAQLGPLVSSPEGSKVFQEWIVWVFNSSFVGRSTEVSDFVAAHPEILANIKSPEMALQTVEAACLGWIESGRAQMCDERLKQVEKMPGAGPEFALRLNIVRGRYLFLTGQSEQAISLLKTAMGQAVSAPLYRMWINFGLSQYYSAVTQPAQVKENLEAFQKAPAARSNGWLNVVAITRGQTIALDQGHCKESLRYGDQALAFLKTEVRGEIAEHAWITFFQTLCQLQLGQTAAAAKSFAKLSEMMKGMPSLKFQKDLAQAAITASQGKSPKAELDMVAKRLGPKHPELVRTAALIEKIPKFKP